MRFGEAGRPGSGGRLRRGLAALAAAAAVALPFVQVPAAHALPPQDVPAVGVDTGRFKLPIGCTITLAGLPVFYLPTDVDVQGMAPVQLGPESVDVGIAVGAHIPLVAKRGGSFSFTGASGALVIPAETVNRLIDQGHSSASGAESVSVRLGSAAARFAFDGGSGTVPAACDAPSPKVYLVDNPVT